MMSIGQSNNLQSLVPKDWHALLQAEFEQDYFQHLEAFLEQEMISETVFPRREHIFSALSFTPFEQIKVLILGQDPYHNPGQAHGLAFSVPPAEKIPPSLRNMYKELQNDLGIVPAQTGNLIPWAQRGVLLLNAVLTVREKAAASHQKKGWEQFTDAVIRILNDKHPGMVFVLWGNYARKKAKLIDTQRHIVIEGVHPSPLAASRGFFGSKPFSGVNKALKQLGQSPIDWRLET